MNIVIPLAGKDPRYTTFKPFIPFYGKPLISHIVEQHRITDTDKLIFILLKEFEEQYAVSTQLKVLFGDKIILRILPHETKGAPCSILEGAENIINTNEPVLIELGDVLRDLTSFHQEIRNVGPDISGIIPVEQDRLIGDRPWGYITTDSNGTMKQLIEKEYPEKPGNATMGLYFFSKGSDFVRATKDMIRNNSFVYNGNYFVGPVYNELIHNSKKITLSHVRIKHILGSPEDFKP